MKFHSWALLSAVVVGLLLIYAASQEERADRAACIGSGGEWVSPGRGYLCVRPGAVITPDARKAP